MSGANIDGVHISGGVVNAGAIVAGKQASAVSVVLHGAQQQLAGRGQQELASLVAALQAALQQHQDELPDRAGAQELAVQVATELQQPRPVKARLQEFLVQLTAAAGSATAVAGAATALQDAVTSLL